MDRYYKHILCFLIILLFAFPAYSQVPDTLQTAPGDTAASSGEDSTGIEYGCELEEYDVINNVIILTGTEANLAWIEYDDLRLEALKILFFQDKDSVVAEGMEVAADPDSFPGGKRLIGQPVVIQEGENPLLGVKMTFNLVTRKAKVEQGRTEFEGGYYFGEDLVRVDSDHIQIGDGYFTSCDKAGEPHFHFRAKQMKMKIKDKVVAKPIIFYIGDLPIMMLPFGVFPITGGRSSGFIMPSYGQNNREGRYLQHLGYYFAINDYTDLGLMMDYYDKAGMLFSGDFNYNKRYSYRGSINGSISRKSFGDRLDFEGFSKERQWDLSIRHSQEFEGRDMNISVSGNFQSGQNFNQMFSNNIDVVTRRLLSSNATLNKRFGKNSLSVNLSRHEDLESGNINETLPRATFQRGGPVFPFRSGSGTGPGQDSFLSNLNFTYNANLNNKRSKTKRIVYSDLDTTDWEDDYEGAVRDTLEYFDKVVRSGMQQNMNFSAPVKVFKHFSVSPGLRYAEEWFNEAKKFTGFDEENNPVFTKETGFYSRRTFNLSVSGNTKFYGVFNPNIGRLKTIRHVVTPSISFSLRPDFSELGWGYWAAYVNNEGEEIEYDRFEGSIFGGTPGNRQKSLNFSLTNLFQVKTQNGEEEEKFDILNVSLRTSYNFALPEGSKKLSSLSTSARILKFIPLNMSLSHNFYRYGTNELLIKNKPLWKAIRLTSLRFNTTFNLKSKKMEQSQEEDVETEADFLSRNFQGSPFGADSYKERFTPENELDQQDIPWDLRVSSVFNLSKSNPNLPRKTFTTNVVFNFHLTKGWRIGYRGDYDVIDKDIRYQQFSFYRDLHCWEIKGSWTPSASRLSGIWFEIRVKDPKLSDLKFKKSSRALGFR
ncbi:MAG: LPS-assembly protein LptD [bacterium]|nr:LPS-assembly protein LptD [bacterium]